MIPERTCCAIRRVSHVRSDRDWRCPTPQGGSPLPDRARQLRRRYRAAGDGRWRFRALAARAMPGVLAVFTGADLKADGVNGLPCGWGIKGKDGQPMKEPPHPAMAQDKVRYVGDAVAFVVAESVQQARNAAEALAVDYHVLPAVIGLSDALKPDTALVYDDVPNNLCCDWDLGDKAATDAALSRAAHVARIKLVNNRLVGNPMEPRAAIAEFHPETGHYTLWSTSQFPHVVRLLMGLFVLNIPQQK